MTSGSEGLPEDSFEDVINVDDEVKAVKQEEERFVLDSVVVPTRRSKLATEKTTSMDNLTLSNSVIETAKEEIEKAGVSHPIPLPLQYFHTPCQLHHQFLM